MRVFRSLPLAAVVTMLLVAGASAHPEHRVEAGDTLFEIARRHDVSLDALRRANGIPADSDLIHPGQVLRIPTAGETDGIADRIGEPGSGGHARGEGEGAWVTAGALNVRSGPGVGHSPVGVARRGDRVRVVGEEGAWREIEWEGERAWVHGEHLAAGDAPAPSRTSRAGFERLPDEGPGFYGYYAGSRRWGTPRLVRGLQRVARRWAERHPDGPRIGFGDLSLENGGDISGHASHERGVDVDLSPLRNDGREARRDGLGKLKWQHGTYSRALTQELIDLLREELPVTHIFYNDPRARGVQPWPHHDNHLHVRIRR